MANVTAAADAAVAAAASDSQQQLPRVWHDHEQRNVLPPEMEQKWADTRKLPFKNTELWLSCTTTYNGKQWLGPDPGPKPDCAPLATNLLRCVQVGKYNKMPICVA